MQLAGTRANLVVKEDAKTNDAVGQTELKCVLSMQVIMTMQEGVSEEDQKTVIGVMKKIQKNIGNQIDSCSNNK